MIPSLKGAQAALSGQMAAPAAAAGASAGGIFGGRFAGALSAGGLAVAGAAIVGGLAAVGGAFDEAFDTIRVGTGATGDALDGLKDDFRAVVRDIPTDFGTASTAIADLNTRLGLTGKPLQDVSKQVIELSRLTGTDLEANIQSVTRLMGDWAVPTGEQSERLDQLFRASQASGIGVNELSRNVVQFGAPMRNLGFTLDESIALFAKWEREGVNVSTAMGGMRIAVGNFARDGYTPMEGMRWVMSEVEKGTFSMADAMEVFGARAGADMFAALREGRFDLDEMLSTIQGGSDTILGAARDTNDWRESLEILKNRALLLLEPVAVRVFEAFTALADGLLRLTDVFQSEGLTGALRFLQESFDRLPGPIKAVGVALMAVFHPWLLLAGAAVYAYTRFEWFRNAVDAVARWLVGTAWPAIQSFAAFLRTAFDSALAYVRELWAKFGDDIVNIAGDAWELISESVSNALDYLRGIFDVFAGIVTGDWSRAWDGVRAAAAAVWRQIGNVVANGVQIVARVIRGFGPALVRQWLAMNRALLEGARNVLGEVLSFYASLPGRIVRVLAGAPSRLVPFGGRMLGGFLRGAIDRIAAVISWFRALPGRIARAVGNVARTLFSRGVGIITGMFNGIKGGAGNMIVWLVRLPFRIREWVTAGGLGRLVEVGRQLLRGLWDGAQQAAGNVMDWARGLAGRIVSAVGNLGRVLYNAGRAIIQGLWDGMKSVWESVTGWLSGLGNIVSALKGPLDYDRRLLIPAGEAIMAGLREGLESGWRPVEQLLKDRTAQFGGEFTVGATPVTAARGSGPTVRVVIDVTGAPDAMVREIRKRVRVSGGNVQTVLGQ